MLELLFQRPGLPSFPLPAELVGRYGGDLGFSTPRLFANFVASVDGVVALRGSAESGRIISGGNEADRFLMGLLRACADAVLIGAGTFRKATGHRWHADAVFPSAAAPFAELRTALGLRPRPPLILLTASGDIDPKQLALEEAVIVTTLAGESQLRGKVPASARFLTFGEGSIALAPLLTVLRAEGFGLVLTEGGPSLVGELLAEKLLDELFLTSSPTLFGRSEGDQRKSLLNGVELARTPLELLSVRRAESFLFSRYAVQTPASTP